MVSFFVSNWHCMFSFSALLPPAHMKVTILCKLGASICGAVLGTQRCGLWMVLVGQRAGRSNLWCLGHFRWCLIVFKESSVLSYIQVWRVKKGAESASRGPSSGTLDRGGSGEDHAREPSVPPRPRARPGRLALRAWQGLFP